MPPPHKLLKVGCCCLALAAVTVIVQAASVRRLQPQLLTPKAAHGGAENGHCLLDSSAERVSLANITMRWAPVVEELLLNVLVFWASNGPDREHGGFHGALDREGRPLTSSAITSSSTTQQASKGILGVKSLIHHARHLWFFSSALLARDDCAAAAAGYDGGRVSGGSSAITAADGLPAAARMNCSSSSPAAGSAQLLQLADRAYQFLMTAFLDTQDGESGNTTAAGTSDGGSTIAAAGGAARRQPPPPLAGSQQQILFNFMVDRTGTQVVDAAKNCYANMQTAWALAAYARVGSPAAGQAAARRCAVQTFLAVDALAHDASWRLGYDLSGVKTALDSQRLPDGRIAPKELNTMLHALEALSALARAAAAAAAAATDTAAA